MPANLLCQGSRSSPLRRRRSCESSSPQPLTQLLTGHGSHSEQLLLLKRHDDAEHSTGYLIN